MKCTSKFIQDIPIEKRKLVLRKMKEFEKQLLTVKNYTMLSKGLWVRRIEGTNIYKFRINNGDRVLFQYSDIDREVIYIAYSNHDSQIRIAKSLNKEISIVEIDIDESYKINKGVYEQCDEEEKLDYYMQNVYSTMYYQMKLDSVFEDEYISLAVESEELSDKQFLTSQQFDCLEIEEKSTVVLGCAGSGKTLIALMKLKIDYKLGFNTVYITSSEQMKLSAKNLCIWMSTKEKEDYFFTLNDICWKILNVSPSTLIQYPQFKIWLEGGSWTLLNKLTPLQIWYEIQSIIKGAEEEFPLMPKQIYLKSSLSNLGKTERHMLHILATSYQSWMSKNGYWDENDLIKSATKALDNPIFDGIIYDEIQEVNTCTIRLLSKLVSKNEKILLMGDRNQRISLLYDNYDFIKNWLSETFSLKILNKNFRNNTGIVKWNNRLKMKQDEPLLEEAVTFGNAPYYTYYTKNSIGDIFKYSSSDIESIVIVANEKVKEQLSKIGYEIGRVFTIEESRGLEYKRVYCYNLLKYLEDELNYNSLYLASSRSKTDLFFIETTPITVLKYFEDCYTNLTEVELLDTFNLKFDREVWINEGKRLEELEKYKQAISAYERAGDIQRASLCRKAKQKQIADIALKEQGILVDIVGDKIEQKTISLIFKEFFSKQNKLKLSWIQVITYHKADGLPLMKNIYLEERNDVDKIASYLAHCIDEDRFCKEHLTIKLVPTKPQEDYRIIINNENLIVEFKRCIHWRQEEELREENRRNFLSKWGYPMRTHLREIIDEEKKNQKSTKEILDEILGF